MKRSLPILLALSVLSGSSRANTFHVGPEGVPPDIATYIACLALGPIGEPFAWLGGRSLFKETFLPDQIRIETAPSGADVIVFFRRGDVYSTSSDVQSAELKRFRGVTPLVLKAAPAFGFGKNSRYTLLLSKPGYKPRIEEMVVSGSAKRVFALEPLAPAREP